MNGMRPFFWNAFCRWSSEAQLLGLEVGRDQGAVQRVEPALVLPGPGARIAE